MDASTQEAIVERLVGGEDLAGICEAADMPSLSTVFRQMRRSPNFASEIRRAREGFAEHLFQKILQAAEDMTPGNVAEIVAKVRIWQWAAIRCAPGIYSERAAVAQIAAPAVAASNVLINDIDVKSLATEELLEFRRLLAKAARVRT